MNIWRYAGCAMLALGASGCMLDNAAQLERRRKQEETANRLNQVEEGVRRLEGTLLAVQQAVEVELKEADGRTRQMLSRMEQALNQANARQADAAREREEARQAAAREREAEARRAAEAKQAEAKKAEARKKPQPKKEREKLESTPENLRIQAALKRAGYDPGAVDGKMGLKTKQALTRFQQDNGLKPDGVAGPQTLARLQPYMEEGGNGAQPAPLPDMPAPPPSGEPAPPPELPAEPPPS